MIRYAITDRSLFPGNDVARRTALIEQIYRCCAAGIDFVQIRERDLPSFQLEQLTRQAVAFAQGNRTRILINSRADVGIATGAAGVHLTAALHELTPAQVRELYARAGLPRPFISAACHSVDEVLRAKSAAADLLLFAPVFEKSLHGEVVSPGVGLDRLHEACLAATPLPVLALGGVTAENQQQCLAAGAAGIAAIRLFQ